MTCEQMVARAISNTMSTIRADVEMGNGPVIEADAVLLNVAETFCVEAGIWDEAKAAFFTACDLDNLIPSDSFREG